MIGVLYYALLQGGEKGELVFVFLFALLTVVGVWIAAHVQRTAVVAENVRFRALLMGIILIVGSSAAAGIPLLYHSRKFGEYVL